MPEEDRRLEEETLFRKWLYRIVGVVLGVIFVVCFLHYRRVDEETYGGKIKLRVWGISPHEGYRRLREVFEEQYPNVRIAYSAMNLMDEQKLMCGVAGGSPPDLVFQDRFAMAGWAARGAYMPLDNLLERDKDEPEAIREEDYYPGTWQEIVYKGGVYGIPNTVGTRPLLYNKDLLVREGLVDENGEARPPKTWEELEEYNRRLTKFDEDGEIVQLGFVPIFLESPMGTSIRYYGNSWLYLYGFLNGGRFMSDDGETCTLDDPRIIEALEWMRDFYDMFGTDRELGISRVQRFQATFQFGALDPFVTGRVAMYITVGSSVGWVAAVAPDLDYGVAWPPAPEGKTPVTWAGGFCWCIPQGAKHAEWAWRFVKYTQSLKGVSAYEEAMAKYQAIRGQPHFPIMYSNRVLNEAMQSKYRPTRKNVREAVDAIMAMLPTSLYRPVTPIGKLLWDEHVRATELALHHDLEPAEALRRGAETVQKRLDEILEKTKYRDLDLRIPAGIAVLILMTVGTFAGIRALRYFRLHRSRMVRKENLAAYLFISPWIVGVVVFSLGPIIASVVLSFCEYDVVHPPKWVGLENYANLLSVKITASGGWAPWNWSFAAKDRVFWKSLWNTFFMMLGIPLGLTAGLGIALLLNRDLKGIAGFRTLFYLPAIVPFVASSVLWMWVLNPTHGLVNVLLRELFGVGGPAWLNDPRWSKPAMILMGLWGAGGGMIIWLAGLKGIPSQLYEAAEIDGASTLRQFWHITLPMLSPYIFFNMIMGVIRTLQIFARSYIMTNGGPVDSTLFYVFYLFNCAFRYFRMGYASALAWILFVIILLLTLVQLKLAPRWVHYEVGKRR